VIRMRGWGGRLLYRGTGGKRDVNGTRTTNEAYAAPVLGARVRSASAATITRLLPSGVNAVENGSK
jgi:hypothetical protein